MTKQLTSKEPLPTEPNPWTTLKTSWAQGDMQEQHNIETTKNPTLAYQHLEKWQGAFFEESAFDPRILTNMKNPGPSTNRTKPMDNYETPLA